METASPADPSLALSWEHWCPHTWQHSVHLPLWLAWAPLVAAGSVGWWGDRLAGAGSEAWATCGRTAARAASPASRVLTLAIEKATNRNPIN